MSASGRIAPSMYGVADVIALMSPIVVVVAAISVPMLDLLLAVVRRVRQGKSPFSADKMHLHHRLLSMGHSHRRVVLVLYTWVSVVAYAAVATTVFPAPFVALTSGVLLVFAELSTLPAGPTPRAPSCQCRADRQARLKSCVAVGVAEGVTAAGTICVRD